jgi:glyoxylase-like metal-dependent hydrolase (beta-lactamase superfamily II)
LVRLRYVPRREAIAKDARAFARFLAAEGLTLATDLLVPHARLVTPEASPIRFDARFFVAPHPDGQAIRPLSAEVPEAAWMSPARALREAAAGRLAVPIPTMAVLQGLAEVPGYQQLLAGARARREVSSGSLSPLVSYVLAPNPGAMTGAGTNTYVVGTGPTVIIDPAVPDPIYIERVARTAGARARPSMVLLTHMHPDHTGGAGVLAAQMGCPVAAWEGVRDPLVTRPLREGEAIEVGGGLLRVLYTPGHASHHVCFLLEQERALFAGDVVAGSGTVVIAPPDGDMARYLDTLERLRDLRPARIYPGHGPVVEEGTAKLEEYIAHRRERERQILQALHDGVGEVPQMVKRIYTDVPDALHPMAELSVLAHLQMLEAAGRVRREGASWVPRALQ